MVTLGATSDTSRHALGQSLARLDHLAREQRLEVDEVLGDAGREGAFAEPVAIGVQEIARPDDVLFWIGRASPLRIEARVL